MDQHDNRKRKHSAVRALTRLRAFSAMPLPKPLKSPPPSALQLVLTLYLRKPQTGLNK